MAGNPRNLATRYTQPDKGLKRGRRACRRPLVRNNIHPRKKFVAQPFCLLYLCWQLYSIAPRGGRLGFGYGASPYLLRSKLLSGGLRRYMPQLQAAPPGQLRARGLEGGGNWLEKLASFFESLASLRSTGGSLMGPHIQARSKPRSRSITYGICFGLRMRSCARSFLMLRREFERAHAGGPIRMSLNRACMCWHGD